jgi:Flp pilus assembly pilin Flp
MRGGGGRSSEAGQTFSEYALMLGALALVCVLGVQFLGHRIADLFDSTAGPIATTTSHDTPPRASVPTTIADCEDDGWRGYPEFSSEEDCVDFVDRLGP